MRIVNENAVIETYMFWLYDATVRQFEGNDHEVAGMPGIASAIECLGVMQHISALPIIVDLNPVPGMTPQ
jgi:hypothetical protein